MSEIPKNMTAVVYHGKNDMRIETVPVPAIGPGELLIRIHTCGICGTDLKKISTGSHSAPRIFGHEAAGVVVAAGTGVTQFRPGDRVMYFHHVPCGECFYCRNKVFAQCPVYKKVGATAGYEPSGGGFAEYARVMDWIVNSGGVVKLPSNVSYEQASFIEPVNTGLKAIETLNVMPGQVILVMGQGPIGIMLALLARRKGATVVVSDLYPQRLALSKSYGIEHRIEAGSADPAVTIRQMTEGRGADAVILAVASDRLIRPCIDTARPGGKVMLFAQTQRSEVMIDPASVCVDEKTILGSYSSSVDLQDENVRLVCSGEIDFTPLISHRFDFQGAVEAIRIASNPGPDTMKLVLQPGLHWEK